MTYEKIYDIVKQKFSGVYLNRFIHMEGVVKMALRLNEHHGLNLNPEKVKLAGLLHDYAKIIKISELEEVIRKEYSGELLENILEVPATYHSFAGAYYIKRDFNIDDEEILDAVIYHTTGKKDMAPLTKLIFISDYIEEGRNFESALIARQVAFDDLDLAVVKVYELGIKKVQKANQKLFKGTEAIYKYYLERMNLKNWNC